jgi:hypothetical protein
MIVAQARKHGPRLAGAAVALQRARRARNNPRPKP